MLSGIPSSERRDTATFGRGLWLLARDHECAIDLSEIQVGADAQGAAPIDVRVPKLKTLEITVRRELGETGRSDKVHRRRRTQACGIVGTRATTGRSRPASPAARSGDQAGGRAASA